ncbi:MAG: Integrase, catalytic region [Devosia sp.]|uniref:integrase catalytic domain-containing protein n=1 Tax=Devosia sp. TaxID=1871048 RepID=UPI00261D1612|nr:transposase family protein [Devosia sp.]MDB5530212.1 Integrase, catalytic region [Devosia sp.]
MNELLRNGFAAGQPLPRASLDDMMADDLKVDDIVFIDEIAHKFLAKIEHGPHVFWNGDQEKQVQFGTAELLNLQAEHRYYRPGRGAPKFAKPADADEHRSRLRVAFNAFPEASRRKAEAKYLFVTMFKTMSSKPDADIVRNEGSAKKVIEAVEAAVEKSNALLPDDRKIVLPQNRSPRSVLRWIAKEEALQLQGSGLLHGTCVTPRPQTIPPKVYEIVAGEIRRMVGVSHKFGPTKILIMVKAKIEEYNDRHGTKLEAPSLTTVQNEYRRFDAWIRLAKAEGVAKADLEYGSVGKLERPARILDLVEVDHHKFDLHPVTGDLGKTHLGVELAKGGLDRFWICLALDVHSGYPLGFAITFEPGGLIPAVMCIDHAIRPKTYVGTCWPDIRGDLLGFGKPVKLRYDNAKEFVSLQLQQNLARIGVGFELAVPGKPNSKPYVERHFGTIERDFVHWLAGSTGANIGEKGDRRPQKEAAVNLDSFTMLFHQYLIECFARREQNGLDGDTPEQRWLRGASSASHRPRPLTPYEQSRWDVVTTLEPDLNATDEGIRWKNIFYQSPEVQAIRRHAGHYGPRSKTLTPVRVRIPLLDVSRAYVAVPVGTPGFAADHPGEILAVATNPHVAGRTVWQHQVVCDDLKRSGGKPTNPTDYELGFRRLFRNAMEAMGANVDGDPGKVTLTGGQAPRFAGVYLVGADQPAFAKTKETLDRYDLLAEFADADADGIVSQGAGVPEEPAMETSKVPGKTTAESAWGAAPIDDDEE